MRTGLRTSGRVGGGGDLEAWRGWLVVWSWKLHDSVGRGAGRRGMERLRRPLVHDLTTEKIKDDVDRLGGRILDRLSYKRNG
jgi:hypothetical protein